MSHSISRTMSPCGSESVPARTVTPASYASRARVIIVRWPSCQRTSRARPRRARQGALLPKAVSVGT